MRIAVVSISVLTGLGKPQVHGKTTDLKADDRHQLTNTFEITYLCSSCEVWQKIWTASKRPFTQSLCKQHHNGTLARCEGLLSWYVKLIQESQPIFCKARQISLPQNTVTEKVEHMVRQGILQPVQPGGVTNASPVVCQRNESGELRLCVNLKVYISGKVMDGDYQIPDRDNLQKPLQEKVIEDCLYVWHWFFRCLLQTELHKEAKVMHNQQLSGLFKTNCPPQWLKNSFLIFQNCMESALKRIKGNAIFQVNVLVYATN